MDYRVKRANLTEQVSSQLLRYIQENDLQPGDELPTEAELTQMFGVSRTVIREGLSAVAALGLIVAESGRRSRVANLSSQVLDNFFMHALRLDGDAVAQLLEVREALEVYAVGLAARRNDKNSLQELRDQLAAMDKALEFADQEVFVEADVEFHLTLSRMGGNEILTHLLSSLRSSTRHTIASGLAARGSTLRLADIQKIHVEIFDAVAAGDHRAASDAMTRHFELAISAVRHPEEGSSN